MLTLEHLLAALILVESNGDPNAIGDGGRAIGILQIHAGVIEDVNRIYHHKLSHRDAADPRMAKLICRLYLGHWGEQMHDIKLANLNTTLTMTECSRLARTWNGGPRGADNPRTLKYWDKVKAVLDQTPRPTLATLNPAPVGHVSDVASPAPVGHVSDVASPSPVGHVSDVASPSSVGHVSDVAQTRKPQPIGA